MDQSFSGSSALTLKAKEILASFSPVGWRLRILRGSIAQTFCVQLAVPGCIQSEALIKNSISLISSLDKQNRRKLTNVQPRKGKHDVKYIAIFKRIFSLLKIFHLRLSNKFYYLNYDDPLLPIEFPRSREPFPQLATLLKHTYEQLQSCLALIFTVKP